MHLTPLGSSGTKTGPGKQEFVHVWPAEVAIMQLIDKDLGF